MTPGHTHEHLAFLLLDGDREVGVFTGGSLMVGSAARTDLVSEERTEELTRAQYASLRRLAALPGEVQGGPPTAPDRSARHRRAPNAPAPSPASWPPTRCCKLPTKTPSWHSSAWAAIRPTSAGSGRSTASARRCWMATRKLAPLSVDEVRARLADGAILIDARPVDRFAAAHVRGAISIPLRPVFASWLGWLAPADRPLIIVRDPDQDAAEIAWQAAKIGYDNIIGELDGGMAAWTAAGHDTASIPLTRPGQLDGRRVLDIRQRSEYLDGHLPGAMHVELGDIAEPGREVPDEPTVVMCGHGERAMGAASLLEGAGHHDLVVLDGGPRTGSQATGGHLETAHEHDDASLDSGCAPTSPSSVCWSRSTPSSAAWSARNNRAAAAGRAGIPPDLRSC